MTLEDEKRADTAMSSSANLREVLHDAAEQSRLTCGINECGQLLEINPDGIMFCLLPENTDDDVTLHIHLTLIEAFCLENFIRVIKVDSLVPVAEICTAIESRKTCGSETVDLFTASDFNCVLIEYPVSDYTPAEEKLVEFHKVTSDLIPQPVLCIDE